MDMDEADLLRETGEEDPALALKMFRVLLDTAQEKLMEPEVAEHLIGYDLLELCQYFKNEQMERQILKELEEDETFARQLFQSACEGELRILWCGTAISTGYHSSKASR